MDQLQLPATFPGVTGQVITALQLFIAATSYSVETNAKTRAQYSKFSRANDKTTTTWPSRVAMMIIYTPAFLASAAFLIMGMYGVKSVPLLSLATAFCCIQFAKRCLEVMFLHKYSGRTDKGTPTQISVYYTLVTVLIAYASGSSGHDASIQMISVGTALFVVGIIGNFYHHYLLANLRSNSSTKAESKKYVAPRGGLFSFVATPHYLFELIGWLGIAIVSNHLNSYLVFASMTSYLFGRAVAQNEWNRLKFDEKEWPLDRKNMIPFIF